MTFYFRKEVFAARQQEHLGSMQLKPPRLGWVFLSAGLFTVGSILVLLFFGHYTDYAQVSGVLVPDRGLLTSRATEGGVVTHLFVHDGDNVRIGQRLLEISALQTSAQLGDTQNAIARQLRLKRSRLEEDIEEQRAQNKLKTSYLADQLRILHRRIARLSEQIQLQEQRANSARKLYTQWVKAGKTGVVSKLRLLQQHDTSLHEQISVKDLQTRLLELLQSESSLRGQLAELPAEAAQKRNATRRDLADVAENVARSAQQSATVLRAHASGEIATVMVRMAQEVRKGQSLLTLLPKGSTLQARLWVPNKAIGFIQPGAHIALRYRAYPYQEFGQYRGTVSAVSLTTVPPADIEPITNSIIQVPMYRVEVALDLQSVFAYGSELPLKPGMTLDAEVQLGRRSLIDWILEPIHGLSARYTPNSLGRGK